MDLSQKGGATQKRLETTALYNTLWGEPKADSPHSTNLHPRPHVRPLLAKWGVKIGVGPINLPENA